MRRNAILAGVTTLLLSIAAVLWTAGSVPNAALSATPAIQREAAPRRRTAFVVPSSRKKRRAFQVAAAVVSPPPAPIIAAVDQPTISEHHKILATAVLGALPAGCRDNLKTFAVLYTGATRRGLGGKTTIILDGSVPDEEFAALLTHECGHVISANLQGDASTGESNYHDGRNAFYQNSPVPAFWKVAWKTETSRLSGNIDADFVSGYAKSDAFEDFAETFAAYVLQRGMLRERAKTNAAIAAKLAWMEKTLPLQENLLGEGSAVWNGEVPWDVTRLPLTLSIR